MGVVGPYNPSICFLGLIVKPVIGFKITKLAGLFDTCIIVKVNISSGQIYPKDSACIISLAGTEIILPPKPKVLAKAVELKEKAIIKINSIIRNLFFTLLLYNIFSKNHNIFLLILPNLLFLNFLLEHLDIFHLILVCFLD